jgi:hypothetical protein
LPNDDSVKSLAKSRLEFVRSLLEVRLIGLVLRCSLLISVLDAVIQEFYVPEVSFMSVARVLVVLHLLGVSCFRFPTSGCELSFAGWLRD